MGPKVPQPFERLQIDYRSKRGIDRSASLMLEKPCERHRKILSAGIAEFRAMLEAKTISRA